MGAGPAAAPHNSLGCLTSPITAPGDGVAATAHPAMPFGPHPPDAHSFSLYFVLHLSLSHTSAPFSTLSLGQHTLTLHFILPSSLSHTSDSLSTFSPYSQCFILYLPFSCDPFKYIWKVGIQTHIRVCRTAVSTVL